MKNMIIKENVHFQTKPEKVWDLLTNPEMTKQYMYGCEIISDYKIGSSINWKGQTENGEEIIYVTGKILDYVKGVKLISTTFDPNSGMKDIPENHVELTYILTPTEDGTLLTIIQGDFAGAEDGLKRFEESKKGWVEFVIPTMKKLLNKQ